MTYIGRTKQELEAYGIDINICPKKNVIVKEIMKYMKSQISCGMVWV